MGETTGIQWTDATWNPVRGCSRVSPGCGGAKGEGGCYAEKQAARFSGPGMPYEGLVRIGKQGARWTGTVRLVPEHLEDPLRWRKPRRIFVNSMSDLFHEGLKDHEIANVFSVMESARSRGHTFQILTKRARRMREWVTAWARKIDHADDSGMGYAGRYSHVWLGVSAENQECADERIPELLQTPAAVRFVSYEPALGPINFVHWLGDVCTECSRKPAEHASTECPSGYLRRGLDWIIVGGESGPGARLFDLEWARSAARQCKDSGVACFVKQLGAKPHDTRGQLFDDEDGDCAIRLKDRHGGDMSEWPDESLKVREFPRIRIDS